MKEIKDPKANRKYHDKYVFLAKQEDYGSYFNDLLLTIFQAPNSTSVTRYQIYISWKVYRNFRNNVSRNFRNSVLGILNYEVNIWNLTCQFHGSMSLIS